MHWNLMNDKVFGSKELLRLKYRRGDQIILTFCKIGSLQKLGPPSFICRNFKTLRKVLPNKTKKNWNAMNYEEFGSGKLLKLKYRRGDQVIQTFCRIGSPRKLDPPSLICRNFRTPRKVLLIHAEMTEKREPNNCDILQNWFPPEIRSTLFNL